MKNVCLALLVCVVSALALAQTDSPIKATDQATAEQLQVQESPVDGLILSPAAANFGNQPMGHQTLAPFTLTNAGLNNITMLSIAPSGGYSIYTPPGGTGCPNRLMPGQNCSIVVAFEASMLGPTPSNSALMISYEVGGIQKMLSASLSANGISQVTLGLALVPPNHVTCNYNLGGSPCTVTLVNQQPGYLRIHSVAVSSPYFEETDDCQGARVAPFGTCTITLTCDSCNNGTGTQGTLTVSTDAPDGSPPALNLQGCRIYSCIVPE